MRRGFERRTALMTMAMLAGTSLTNGVLAQDDSVTRVEDTPALAQAPQAVAFDIPAQPLASALTAFGRQSGYQVSVDQATLANLNSAPVSGSMPPEEALRRLLSGTGLAWRAAGGRSVFITKAADGQGALQLDPVQIQGFAVPSQAMIDNIPPPYAGGQVATGGQLGLLGNRSVMDTPFNQTNYTARKAQDQQAKTVRDVLIDDPSARSIYSDGSAATDLVNIRGFPVFAGSMSYGGLYGMLPTLSPMAELAERIEVLKGPSAFLNGLQPLGAIGGTINIVPKRAADVPLTQMTANYISNTQFGIHADVARRFGEEKQFGARFNGVYRSGETAVQGNYDQRGLTVLGLDYRGDRVRVSADLGYQYDLINGVISYIGLAPGVSLPWAPNARSNPNGQPWSYQERKDLFGTVRAEVDLTDRITAYAAFGAHDYRLGALYSSFLTVTNVTGTATAGAPRVQSQYNTYLTGEAGLRGFVDTGPIGHEFALTATTYREEAGFGQVNGTAFASNLYNATVIARPNIATPSAGKTSVQGLSSLAIADTLSAVDKRIQLTVGARLQRVTLNNYNAVTGAETSTYDQSAISPSVALVFKPWENVSLYGNWIQGLQPGNVVPVNFSNAGEVFPPYKSTQFEAGVKVDWGKFTTTMSLFQISRPSLISNVATNTLLLAGEQRNQGLEFNFFGEPIEGVRLIGGAMLLNAVLTKTQGGLTDGWTAPFSPGLQLNLGGEWDMPFMPGLTLSGRAIYTAAQYIDTTFPRRMLPEWTRFDIGARYMFEATKSPLGKPMPIAIRFNVENLLDTNYWAGGQDVTTLNLGAPRTFRLALTADF